jgi:hypothetical protein
MSSAAGLAISCPEHARLESEFIEARDRMRGLVRLRKLEPGGRAAIGGAGGDGHCTAERACRGARLRAPGLSERP